MSIRIHSEECIGCGRCAAICPGNLIRIGESGKAGIPRVRECWGCTSCVKECPSGAIEFFLGPELDGRGGTLSVRRTKDGYDWTVKDRRGRKTELRTLWKEANRY